MRSRRDEGEKGWGAKREWGRRWGKRGQKTYGMTTRKRASIKEGKSLFGLDELEAGDVTYTGAMISLSSLLMNDSCFELS